jgi:plastocyanin
MNRALIAAAAAGAAAFLFGAAAGYGRSAAVVTLNGTVGPGFTIKLTRAGTPVKTLAPGTYRFVIADRAAVHNFVLERERPGHLERTLTSVSFTGTKTATVTLAKGSWTFYCRPHASTMVGHFTVGEVASAPATTTTDGSQGDPPPDDPYGGYGK